MSVPPLELHVDLLYEDLTHRSVLITSGRLPFEASPAAFAGSELGTSPGDVMNNLPIYICRYSVRLDPFSVGHR